MDLVDIGWIIVVLSGIVWNVYRRIVNLQQEAPRKRRPVQETAQEPVAAPPDPSPAPSPAPRMSSGTRGSGAPLKPVQTAQAASGSQVAATAALANKQNLKNAIILREVLGEPRSKQPWRPGRKGS